ncbi:hypothetical protein ANN_14254 [Periplaneta americana]|uniref:Uncharacterized protein n=1 Tax=Periplaneta americana TaxID=6978 RepID=A0ABQ8SVU2_PERAM|nr:hypothetical protein ANN_14254 [Periplaneta americana]
MRRRKMENDAILKALSSLENANIFLERSVYYDRKATMTVYAVLDLYGGRLNFISRRGGSEGPMGLVPRLHAVVTTVNRDMLHNAQDIIRRADFCRRMEGDNAGEMSPGSSTESYPAFAHIGLRENPGKNLNQVTFPNRDWNPGHLVSRADVLTVTPQVWTGVVLKDSKICSYARVVDEFRRNYPDVEVPNNSTITRLIGSFRECRSALLDNDERDCWFQQDSATCHTSKETMQVFREFFGERIISQGLWPPCSSDLTYPDFFLWDYFKGRVYKNRPHTLEELKRNITTEINNIGIRVLKKVAANMVKRVRTCITKRGCNFQYML